MEDLGLTSTRKGHLQRFQAKLCVKAVGELPAEHMPRTKIHDSHQIKKALLEWDISDIGSPYLIHCCDRPDIHQTGKAFGRITWNRGARLLVDRPQSHAAHEVSHSVTTDWDPFSCQVVNHPTAAAAGILQVKGIDLGHDRQRRLPLGNGAVVQGGSRQAKQRTLATDAELRVVMIDQFPQFTGFRAAETFF
jgi:hypothetical protein